MRRPGVQLPGAPQDPRWRPRHGVWQRTEDKARHKRRVKGQTHSPNPGFQVHGYNQSQQGDHREGQKDREGVGPERAQGLVEDVSRLHRLCDLRALALIWKVGGDQCI